MYYFPFHSSLICFSLAHKMENLSLKLAGIKEIDTREKEGCHFTSKRFFSDNWLTLRLVGNPFFSANNNRQDWGKKNTLVILQAHLGTLFFSASSDLVGKQTTFQILFLRL